MNISALLNCSYSQNLAYNLKVPNDICPSLDIFSISGDGCPRLLSILKVLLKMDGL
jgi:hypothetical protein